MWRWLRRLFRGRGVKTTSPQLYGEGGGFVMYTTFHPGCRMAVQQTLVVTADERQASEYIIWLN